MVFKKTIIGIIGKPGSGKETVGNEIARKVGENTFRTSFSGPLTEFLLDLGYTKEEIDRPLLQKLAQTLIKHFGADAVTRGILHLIQKTNASVIIVDGVRWQSDFDELKKMRSSITDCFMIFVNTSARIRYARLKSRKQRSGEENLAWKEFLKQDNSPVEQAIEKLGERADFKIDNNGSLKNLQAQVRDFLKQNHIQHKGRNAP